MCIVYFADDCLCPGIQLKEILMQYNRGREMISTGKSADSHLEEESCRRCRGIYQQGGLITVNVMIIIIINTHSAYRTSFDSYY